jgi:hypothetical protein
MGTRSYCRMLILICVLYVGPPYLHAQVESVRSGQDLDTAHWKELKNQFGWQLRYPPDWEAWGHGSDTPDAESDDQPEIVGPKHCGESHTRCASLQVSFPEGYQDSVLSPR